MPKVLSSGETRYSAAEVKESGQPYLGSSRCYNGYEDINGVEGFLSWSFCRRNKLREPSVDEKPVAYIYIRNIGSNHYYGLYDRREEYQKWKIWWEEESFWGSVEGSMSQIKEKNNQCHVREMDFSIRWCEKFYPDDILHATFEGSVNELSEYGKALRSFLGEYMEDGLDSWRLDGEERLSFRIFKRGNRKVKSIQTRIQGIESVQHVVSQLKEEQELELQVKNGQVLVVALVDGAEVTLGSLPNRVRDIIRLQLDLNNKVIGEISWFTFAKSGDRMQGRGSVIEWKEATIELIFVEEKDK
ncbi:hypothetical protein J2Z48_002970 [Croceifilum oryzae]|uniref:Uncharacterized protein n=1 Tax=Croceifilum oryzae TaxID=1553429 RepID=A0AAJ1WV88_9BACL|nr:hypothetical protein [Croceifilum oryzae]MDQ0418766.1 hypothetical protein [Croceifilum oryzae]